MHIISRKKIQEFCRVYPNASPSLEGWYRVVKHTTFGSFNDLRMTFPSADAVGSLVIFNIGGNNWRLVAAIHYNTHKIFIRHILTHDQYDEGKWKTS